MTSRRSASAVHLAASTGTSGELADIKRIRLAEASSSSQPARTGGGAEGQRGGSRARQPLGDGAHNNVSSSDDDPDASSSTVARSPAGTQPNSQHEEDEEDEQRARVKRRKMERRPPIDDDEEDDAPAVKPEPERAASHESDRASSDEEGEVDVTQAMDSQPDPSSGSIGPRDSAGFLPGAIVRVALSNFVTYDSVEFHPGPYLNMIIGPNGTGKSTIVCAIALGLGWKPAVLGRAKDVASFVKQGYNEGWIEIELKAPKGARENVIIRRSIKRDDNASDWKLNGKKASAKDIAAAVEQFEVSVDNLCCFLPQDKVADFARMEPPRLLVETQRAAGNANLKAWHERLIDLDKQLRAISASLETDQEHQNNLEQRNEVLGHDVERWQQRERIRNEIELLNLQIPHAQYLASKVKYDELKELRKQRKDELDHLRRQHEPLETKVQEMKDKKAKLENRRAKAHEKVNAVGKELYRFMDRIEKADSETNELQGSLQSLKQREEEQRKLFASLRTSIADLTRQVQDEPEETDTSEIETKIRKCRTSIREAEGRIRDLKEERNDVGEETDHFHRKKDEALVKLKRLDDARSRRLEALRSADNACYNAVLWLRENQHLFEHKVYEPIMLEINVKDPQYTSQVESCLSWPILRTFVCQSRADYDRLTSELIDKRKWPLNVAENQGGRTLTQMEDNRPLTLQQIQNLGFNDYIANLIEAPEPVLQFLCAASNVHLIPVALSDSAVNAEQVESLKQIKRYIAGRSNHTITFSSYGRGLAQTLSRDLKPARALGQSTNQAEKNALEETMRDIAEKLKEAEERVGELNDKIEAEKEKITAQEDKRQELEAQRVDAQKAKRAWERAKIDLASKQKRLDSELARPSTEQERKRIHRDIAVLTEKRAKNALQMTEQLKMQWEHREALDIAVLTELQHGVNYDAWKALLKTKDRTHKEAERAFHEAQEQFQAAKSETVTVRRTAQARLDAASQELSEKFLAVQEQRKEAGQEEPSVAELEETLMEKQSAFDMAQGVPSRVVEAYKKRAEEIKKLGESIMTKRRDAQKLEGRIAETHNQWYPALKSLIDAVSSKFSAAFDRIGCAGEVAIDERQGKYEEWGIEIRVKFRDKESLQPLTGQRQSGGERSLSTILYLMSLTELSRSPFSLVDEINQGMDQRAERAVHDQMVEVTCRENASQYFLITPKLLPDLKYHEKMKVLIINNGEWLPEKLNLAEYARKRKRLAVNGGGPDAAARATPVAA